MTSSVVKSELSFMSTRLGGHFSDVKQIGMGMVNKSSSVPESKSSCMNPDSVCNGDE